MQWLAEICIKRPIFATMLILAITVAGGFSFFSLGVDRFPNVDFPTVTVTVQNPGASPQEIETEITDRIEEEINTVSGIDELRSTSVEGVSQVFVSFKLEKNGDVAAQEVRDKVNLIRNELPQTAEEPIIQKFDVNSSPIMQIAIAAPRSLRDLYDIADKQLAERIQTVDGVGQVQVIGGAEREIQIFINPERMRAYNVTANDVTDAVRRQNQELPGGRIEQGASEITVRTLGRLPKVEDFNAIPIVARDGYTVRLKDIGEVRDGGKEQRTLSLLNGVPSVTLNVRKQSGTNSLAIAEQVKHRLEEIKKDLPADVETNIVGDQTVFIEASVHAVYEHLILGSLFACVIVFIFLWNFRLTLISAVAIPTSIIGTFAIMAMLGYTLDMITLLALTLMVGIVIDDAIIVMENIYHFIESKGMSPFQAAVEGTREVGLAVFATTLSLLAVFLPVGFMGGIVGRFMSSFGLTASAAIAISLLVSFTLTPMLCALFIKASKIRSPKSNENGQTEESTQNHDSKDSWIYRQIDGAYTSMLRWSMTHRWVIVGLCVLVLLSNVLVFSLIGFDFVPEDDESQYQVALRAPEGATLAATSTVAERIAKDIREFPGVTDTLTTVGGGEQEIVNTGTVYVKLKPIGERDLTQAELIARTRELLKQYPSDVRTSVSIIPPIGGGGERNEVVQYLVTGPDLNKLTEYSDKLKERLREVPDAVDVDSSLVVGKPELRVVINRQRAADLGVAVEDISQALNTFLAGSEVSTFNSGTDQFDVRVRAKGNFRRTEQDLRQMSVRSEKGEIITLDQLVSFEPGAGAATIDRFDRERQVTIYSNVRQGGSISAVTAEIENIVKELQFEPGYQPAVTGDAKRLAESGYYFGLAILLTFIFMYMVLAAQFESFIHPITILLTLPLAVPFGVASLLLTGQSMNIFALLGLLVLFGIVKKNAILQIDHTNQLREKGMERGDAIIQANRDRLRPILMTTIAFVAGMIPMLISTGAGAATNRSIGTLVAGGQTFCLLLTLLAVPVFYSLFDDFGKLSIWNKLASRWRLFRQTFKRRVWRPIWSSVVGTVSQKTTSLIIIGLLTFSIVINAQEPKTLNPNVVDANARETNSVSRNLHQQTGLPEEEKAPEAEKSSKVRKYESAPNYSRTGVDLSEPLSLSLQDAIKLALENNNDLRVAETEVRIAEFNLKAARGAFDPALVGESYYERAVTPTASTLQGGAGGKLKENTFSNVFALSGKTPKFGGEYRVEFSNSRINSNSLFNDLNPQFPSRLSFTFAQPLWRGLRTDDTRRRIEVAKKNVSLSDAQFRERTINTISQVESAYWEMVFALRSLQIQQDALKEAREQLESNKRQVEQGVLAPIDIAQAETQVATIEQNLYSAQENVTNGENALKTLLLPSRENANWSRPVIPTSPVELEIPRVALPDALEAALKNRPELAQLETNKEINQINTRYFRDRTKPQVDLVASYTTQGLAGSVVTNNAAGELFNNQDLRDRVNQLSALNNLPPLEDIPPTIGGVPENLRGGNGTSLNNLFRQDYPTYRVGVRIEIPIGNRAAKAELGSSLAEGTKLDYQRKHQEQTIEAEVRNAIEAVRTAEARLKSAAVARESAQKQFDGERRQLTAGTSTVFLVLERQTRRLEAQGRELQAQTDLNKAISNLQQATGGSLNNYRIELTDDR